MVLHNLDKIITVSMMNERWNAISGFDLDAIGRLDQANLAFFLEHTTHQDRVALAKAYRDKLEQFSHVYNNLKTLIIFT